MNLEALGITKEDLIDKLAEKILRLEYPNQEDGCDYKNTIGDMVRTAVEKKVHTHVSESVLLSIDEVLRDKLSEVLEQEVTPVNIFGDKVGKPTTIKAALAEKAKDFWLQKVDKAGKPTDSTWGDAKPRYEFLIKENLRDSLDEVVKANVDDILKGFKSALREDCIKSLDSRISRYFK